MRILTGHFFRRFFDNDTLQVEGDTVTTVVRALAGVAAPGLMIAFFMQTQYPQRTRWGAIGDQYLFVLLSFVVMGAVTIFEWEMLFPDRMDFQILTPLPIRPLAMLGAKGAALAGFVGMFLVGCNVLATVLFPAAAKYRYWRQLGAQAAATGMAGLFSSLLVLATGSVLLCVLGARVFRRISPLLQASGVVMLGLLLVHFVRCGDRMDLMLAEPMGALRWLPSLWFLGVYDTVLYGAGAPAAAREMAPYAWRGVAVLAGVVVATYPLAWRRVQRAALEGAGGRRHGAMRMATRVTGMVARRQGVRAVFVFIGQTMRRNARYQVYLAMYGGVGLALAAACVLTVAVYGGRMVLGVSDAGMHGVMPLLLFWTVAGLKTAFGSPVDLKAGWVFRVTGVDKRECAAAARLWTMGCALGVLGLVVLGAAAVGWGWRALLVQVVCGVCLAVLLTDGFFFARSVPLNEPRMPGRSNFPLLLTLYVGVLGPFVFGMARLEMALESGLGRLVLLGVGTALIHAGVRRLLGEPMEVEEEMEGYEGEFQLLGLS